VAVLPPPTRRLRVAYVDHQLRPSSAKDAVHVDNVASGYGLQCSILTVNVPDLAERERRGVEEAARAGRYRALRSVAHEHGGVVVTGHTASDSVETVLLHLLRGSGLDGLGGLHEREFLSARALGLDSDDGPPLTLVRPLLAVDRGDTVAYCAARGLMFLTDETNADPRLLRNRVRVHLLPVLRTYNPAVDRAIARMAATVQDDEAWIAAHATATWRRLAQVDVGAIRIPLRAWRRQPVAVQRRLVRQAAQDLGIPELGFEAVERARTVATDACLPRADLGGGLGVEQDGDALRFWRQDVSATATRRKHDDGA
jgi:tRNA(Ile)-lysidine synthase